MDKVTQSLKAFFSYHDDLAYSILELYEILQERVGKIFPPLAWYRLVRSLHRLEKAGLIASKHIGNRKFFISKKALQSNKKVKVIKMKVTYDRKAKAMYFELMERGPDGITEELVPDEVIIDKTISGQIAGVEILGVEGIEDITHPG